MILSANSTGIFTKLQRLEVLLPCDVLGLNLDSVENSDLEKNNEKATGLGLGACMKFVHN